MPENAPQQLGTKDVNLVLEGGGVKGVGIIGAVLALDEAGFRFRRVAGTSAGAIAAALVAANVAARKPLNDPDGLLEQIETVDYKRFADGPATPIGQFRSLMTKMGLHSGEYLVEWLGDILEGLGITTFGDLRQPGLGDEFPYSLVVYTTDITQGRLVRLPGEYGLYGKEPDQQLIVDAVRASMAIPFYFEPVSVTLPAGVSGTMPRAASGPSVVTWVDGGLLSNFPMETFSDSQNGVVKDPWDTIGVKLSDAQVATRPLDPTDGPLEELHQILKTLLDNSNRYFVTPEKQRGTIFVDSAGVQTTDFDLDDDQRRQLFENGQSAARAWVLELTKFAATPPHT